MGERTSVAIVGGGIAGLALGFHLRRSGVEARVLEAGPRPGGNIRSEARDGWLCEWGPNGFLDNEPATLRLADALGLGDELLRSSDLTRVRWIVRDGRLRRLPAKPPEFLASDVLSLAGRLRVLLEWTRPARRDPADESVFEFARRRIGGEAAEVLVDAMVTGVYAGDSRRLSLEAAFPRMRAMEREHGSLFRALVATGRARRRARRAGGAAPAGGGPMGPPGTLTSFAGGVETLVRALAGALEHDLRCEARATRLARTAGGFRLEFESGPPLEAEQVVLACPAWHAAPLLAPLDAGLGELVAAIPSAPVAVVCLGYREADLQRVEPGFGFLVPGREKLGILGTLYDTWVFSGRSPAGSVLWRAMIGGARDPAAIELDDAALVKRTLGVFERLLGLRAAPAMTYVVRHARGIPQYPVGHPQRVATILERLGRHPGLHLAGNCYHGISMNACIKEAEALAARIAVAPPGAAEPT
jgi:oxygen-dependent protoporphyrinogen oxidase